MGTEENRRGLSSGSGEIYSNNATPQKKEATKKEGPETPPTARFDLSDAAGKKFIRTAKKRGYGSREPRFRPAGRASGVDLTFAIHLAASPRSECQIQNSTSTLYLLVVLFTRHSQNEPAETDANVRIGPLKRFPVILQHIRHA